MNIEEKSIGLTCICNLAMSMKSMADKLKYHPEKTQEVIDELMAAYETTKKDLGGDKDGSKWRAFIMEGFC